MSAVLRSWRHEPSVCRSSASWPRPSPSRRYSGDFTAVRRLNSLSGNSAALEDIEMSFIPSSVYAFGHTEAFTRSGEPRA